MNHKKKITCKAVAFSTIGLVLSSSSILIGVSTSSKTVGIIQQQNTGKTTSVNVNPSTTTTFKIRSNPTNGFSGLTTDDGRYTYVLITKNGAIANNLGGVNSGVACIDNITGQSIGEWYLPDIPTRDCNLNYTTNIVFGQKVVNGKTVFDESQLFVLCGISNLAGALNRVFIGYENNARANKLYMNDISNWPSIKIFKLQTTINGDSIAYTNTLGENQFYNFAYPSDGTNGYAGFNAEGTIYELQNKDSVNDPNDIYCANDIAFNAYNSTNNTKGIKRTGPVWEGGESFYEIKSTSIYAFSSYLTYLTYGQNFAYHLNQTYKNSSGKINPDEFIMSTSFVNVDQNIGGLYSACVRNIGADSSQVNGINASDVSGQENWPVPFGYQWLLADIANANAGEAKKKPSEHGYHKIKQYTYVNALGNTVDVYWNDPLALREPLINFLNGAAWVTRHGWQYGLLNLLRIDALFGANWGGANGYIIFNPQKAQSTNFTANNISEYRYYYIAEIAMRPFQDWFSHIDTNGNFSNFIFTNLLATNRLSSDGSLSYLIGVAWTRGGNAAILKNGDDYLPKDSGIIAKPFFPLQTPANVSMFCYDWDSISNDDQNNALIQPIDYTKITSVSNNNSIDFSSVTGGANIKNTATTNAFDLKKSFQNWNLIFLGGPSREGINKMDSSYSVDSGYLKPENAFVWCLTMEFVAWHGGATPAQKLGHQLTFLRRKISFVVYPYNGFVYFTAGTGLAWQNGMSLWDVRNVGSKDLFHNCLEHNKFVGTIYLSKEFDTSEWRFWDEAIWAIKEVKQPFGKGGTTLLFIASDAIYTVSGLKNTTYTGSVNNVLANGGTTGNKSLNSGNYDLLSVVAQTKLDNISKGTSQYGSVLPSITVYDHDILRIGDGPDALLYSIQDNNDYLILAETRHSPAIPGVIDDASKVPQELHGVPAAKPLLDLKKFAISPSDIKPNDIRKTLTYEQLNKYSLKDLYETVLGMTLDNAQYQVDTRYIESECGTVIEQVVDSSGKLVNSVKLLIPVTFKKFTSYTNVVYFLPFKTTDGGYGLTYDLNDLKSSAYIPPVLVVLKSIADMDEVLKKKQLTPQLLAEQYGFDDGQTYNQQASKELNDMLVDQNMTNGYMSKKFPGKFDQSQFILWLIAGISDTGEVRLTVKYKFASGLEWQTDACICTVNRYTDNPTSAMMGPFDFSGYEPAENDGSHHANTGVVVGSVVAGLIGVACILGLGIGLPMRKQHKINVLNAKITNRRIDKLTGAVSSSFGLVIQTAMKIDKDVKKFKGTLQRSLAPANTKSTVSQQINLPPPKKSPTKQTGGNIATKQPTPPITTKLK